MKSAPACTTASERVRRRPTFAAVKPSASVTRRSLIESVGCHARQNRMQSQPRASFEAEQHMGADIAVVGLAVMGENLQVLTALESSRQPAGTGCQSIA